MSSCDVYKTNVIASSAQSKRKVSPLRKQTSSIKVRKLQTLQSNQNDPRQPNSTFRRRLIDQINLEPEPVGLHKFRLLLETDSSSSVPKNTGSQEIETDEAPAIFQNNIVNIQDQPPTVQERQVDTNSSKLLTVKLVPSKSQAKRFEKRQPKTRRQPKRAVKKPELSNPYFEIKEEIPDLPEPEISQPQDSPDDFPPPPARIKLENDHLCWEDANVGNVANEPILDESITIKAEDVFNDFCPPSASYNYETNSYSSITIEQPDGVICKMEESVPDGNLNDLLSN